MGSSGGQLEPSLNVGCGWFVVQRGEWWSQCSRHGLLPHRKEVKYALHAEGSQGKLWVGRVTRCGAISLSAGALTVLWKMEARMYFNLEWFLMRRSIRPTVLRGEKSSTYHALEWTALAFKWAVFFCPKNNAIQNLQWMWLVVPKTWEQNVSSNQRAAKLACCPEVRPVQQRDDFPLLDVAVYIVYTFL